MDDIPTTLVTVTTTAHATRWVTLPAKAAPTATATDSLLVSATATQHDARTTAVELADVGEGVPDWPPLLIIFLLCWVVMAWVVAAEQRSGPVMFERDRGEADPFGVEAMVAEAAKGAKRGAEDDGGGKGKKARVDDD